MQLCNYVYSDCLSHIILEPHPRHKIKNRCKKCRWKNFHGSYFRNCRPIRIGRIYIYNTSIIAGIVYIFYICNIQAFYKHSMHIFRSVQNNY